MLRHAAITCNHVLLFWKQLEATLVFTGIVRWVCIGEGSKSMEHARDGPRVPELKSSARALRILRTYVA